MYQQLWENENPSAQRKITSTTALIAKCQHLCGWCVCEFPWSEIHRHAGAPSHTPAVRYLLHFLSQQVTPKSKEFPCPPNERIHNFQFKSPAWSNGITPTRKNNKNDTNTQNPALGMIGVLQSFINNGTASNHVKRRPTGNLLFRAILTEVVGRDCPPRNLLHTRENIISSPKPQNRGFTFRFLFLATTASYSSSQTFQLLFPSSI